MNELVEFYKSYLNDGAYVERYVADGLNSNKFIGYKCCENGKMIGVLTSRNGIDFTYPHKELGDEIKAVCLNRNVYTLDSISVNPEYRKLGVAKEITHLVMSDIKKSGGEIVLMEMWIHPTGYIPVYRMFDEYGKYIYSREIPLFYKELPRYGLTCPICGKDCRCGALIRVMELN